MNHIKSLSKDDQKRHFPDGGKGDNLFRGRLGKEQNNKKQDNYRKGYDQIDWSKK